MIDGVLLEILRNRFQAIVEEMARVMERTAFTTFVKETADFSVGLVAPSGDYVAYPWALGATSYLGINMSATFTAFRDYYDGDVVICNDPYLAGPLCTHLPDVHVLRPIFREGEIISWAHAFVHASDVGGAVPASVWPTAQEIFQEGLRLRPTKLLEKGQVRQDVLDLILDNTRIPYLNAGDLKALLAAVETCARRVHETIQRFGYETFADGLVAVLDHADQRARDVFSRIPNGDYMFSDYLDTDLHSEAPIRIKLCLRSRDGEVTLDFTGSDPQVNSALNIASHGVTHPFLCLGLVAFLVSEEPDIPKASTILRPVSVTAPAGSIVNATFPAPVGCRYGTAMRVADAVLGCLSQALPGRIPAASSGAISPIVVATRDPASGEASIQVAEPLLGGGGARPGSDGIDGADSTIAGYLRNTPIEVVESELPISVLEYGLVRDSGAPGEFRGGLATRFTFEALLPRTVITARGMERCRFAPWGLAGGAGGSTARCTVYAGTEPERTEGAIDVLTVGAGDIVSFVSSSGGGYGEPLRRDPAAVLADVRSGRVSLEQAVAAYGVVIDVDEIDTVETLRARATITSGGNNPFSFGAERDHLEECWTPELQDAVNQWLAELPLNARADLKARLYEVISQMDESPSAAGLDELMAEVSLAMGATNNLGGRSRSVRHEPAKPRSLYLAALLTQHATKTGSNSSGRPSTQ